MGQPYQTWTDPGGLPAGVSSSAPPYRPRWWLHGLLLALTLATTTCCGAVFSERAAERILLLPPWRWPVDPVVLLEGLKFSLPLLMILASHEAGHYLACRRHGLLATPPFFIPFPAGFGTLGAVIRIKQPILSRRQLLDVGAAGPLAGFVALLPFLVAGVALSEVRPAAAPTPGGYYELGEPLAYALLERLCHPDLAAGSTVFLHPTGLAAWGGLLVTLLNLLPFAQLDGGHVTYALLGARHRRVVIPLLALLLAAGLLWWGWLVWALIALLLGLYHPRVMDEHVPLDRRRRVVGWLAVLVFVLCFMPEPIRYVP